MKLLRRLNEERMGIIIDYDAYEEASAEVYKAIKIVAKYYNLELVQLKWSHFYNFTKDILQVHFVKYPLKTELSKIFSGCIIPLEGIITIAYNTNVSLPRRFFTICHEITHRFCDMEDIQKTRGFEDYLEISSIDPKEDFIEYRANVGASLLMCNNEALAIQLASGRNFFQIAEFFYMSQAAMYNRLIEFSVYQIGINPYQSKEIVGKFTNGNANIFNTEVRSSSYVASKLDNILSNPKLDRSAIGLHRIV